MSEYAPPVNVDLSDVSRETDWVPDAVERDVRDQRDPEKVGRALLSFKSILGADRLSEVQDALEELRS